MYFLLIRPQQQRMKEHKKMVENVRRGDTVVTAGGIVGKVAKRRQPEDTEITRRDRRQRPGARAEIDAVRSAPKNSRSTPRTS